MKELNDSVYFIAEEGVFILLHSDRYQGYYDIRGVQSLIVRAQSADDDTSELDSALAILRIYNNDFLSPWSEIVSTRL